MYEVPQYLSGVVAGLGIAMMVVLVYREYLAGRNIKISIIVFIGLLGVGAVPFYLGPSTINNNSVLLVISLLVASYFFGLNLKRLREVVIETERKQG